MFKKIFQKSKSANETKPKNKFNWKKIITFNFSEINPAFYENLEEQLLLGDLGGKQVILIMEELKQAINQYKIKEISSAKEKLKDILKAKFTSTPLTFSSELNPVICFLGVNGTGKTSTLAKVSYYYQEKYPQQIWGAGDTFRAAATIQLNQWADIRKASLVNKGEGADPASVAYDTVHAALAKANKVNHQVLSLLDTAGRLHNNAPLMDELGKIMRIIDRFKEKVERKNLLILDATLGINGFEQAKIFHEKIGLDGIILTKMDTLAKGGSIFSIADNFKLPIYFTTFGEQMQDLAPFNLEEYLDSII